MKNFPLLSLLAVSVCLAGCNDKSAGSAGGEAHSEDAHGINFKAKEGLADPEALARHIGLKLEDVAERKVNGQHIFTAQVYGEAGPQARRVVLASAWVDSLAAKSIPSGTDIVATTADTSSLTGTVTRIVSATDTNAAAEVLLELRAEQGELKLGDFVRVTVSTPGR